MIPHHNAMKYLISKNYREDGPYTPAAMRKRIASGELDKGYYVLTEENVWIPLPEFMELHPARSRQQADSNSPRTARKRRPGASRNKADSHKPSTPA